MQTLKASKLDQFRTNLSPDKGVLPASLKEQAAQVLDNNNFPTTRDEHWKYTRVGKIANSQLKLAEFENLQSKDEENIVIQVINGKTNALPNIEGITILPIAEANELLGKNLELDNEIFHALNTQYTTGGVFIHVPKNVVIEETIHLEHVITQDNTLAAVRHLIVLEESATCKIIQTFSSTNEERSLSLPITEAFVGKNANLTIEKLQQEDMHNFHIATEQVYQEHDSTFTIRTYTLNGGLVRNNLNIQVDGQNCETNLIGTYITKGNQHVDNHTVVDHLKSNCESNELYKGVMDEKSTGVFNGKVFVRKDAQKINAFQSNGNVLLTDDAAINSKPELEIYADDVKCSHGSTTGQLDDEALFYLRARGLSQKSAKQLLIHAFVGEVLEQVENAYLKKEIHAILLDRFDWKFDA